MDVFSLFSFGSSRSNQNNKRNTSQAPERQARRPELEAFEDRLLPSATTISGFVFRDGNNNGILDAGETGLANSDVELRNSAGQVIAIDKTDAQGFYEFSSDSTLDTQPTTSTQTITIPSTDAGFTEIRALAKFDPKLGELLEVEITNQGSITSSVKIENILAKEANLAGVVNGTIKLSGSGFTLESSVTKEVGSFTAGKFDGTIDFQGASGRSFPAVTLTLDSKSVKLTGNDLQAFIGTGKISLTEDVDINASATGGGNWIAGAVSTATATFTVKYKYKPTASLQPGNYTIVQKTQPTLSPGTTAKYLDGLLSRNNVPIPNSVGSTQIPVTLGSTSLTRNNFAEIYPAYLSGSSYIDDNGNGIRDAGELGLGNAVIRLTGKNDIGQDVTREVRTKTDGSFTFWDLRPGNYTLNQLVVTGYLDGQDRAGTLGGTPGTNGITGINVKPGSNGREYTFANLKRSNLSGFVFNDADADGSRDASETGLGSVTITLTGTDSVGAVSKTTTTKTDGSFTFTDLRPGTYTVSSGQVTGYLAGAVIVGNQGGAIDGQKITQIVIPDGGSASGYGFARIKGASLSGSVYRDLDNDGVRDAAETGIQGVQVKLLGSDGIGVTEVSATTDATGAYKFDGLRPGIYTIVETQPNGFIDGKATPGTRGGTAAENSINNITLPAGQVGANYNFGERLPSSLSGFVYRDLDHDGVKDTGETGIQGVTVKLIGSDGAVTINRTVTTDASGAYTFNGLQLGIYSIIETQPDAFIDGKVTPGNLGGTAGDNSINNIDFSTGVPGANYNFGERLPASLSGFVYRDLDNDGVKDIGEAGIQGAEVRLIGSDGEETIDRTVNTDANGAYIFTGLHPGIYTIVETQPEAFIDGKVTPGNRGGTAGENSINNIDLSAGLPGANYNFGERLPVSLSGFVYRDLDNDGVKETGENGIQGVQVKLIGNGTEVFATTDATGAYKFDGLLTGIYTIVETQPEGFIDGEATPGNRGGTASDNSISSINLSAGLPGTNYNFGERPPVSLSGFVYRDLDNDGVKETGENGIQGVQVKLIGNGTEVFATTDATGAYKFDGLRAGIYTIEQTQPDGFIDGKVTPGNRGGTAGDNSINNINLSAGLSGANYNFGERLPTSLSGFVYRDINDNGTRDAGESGIPGVEVKLFGTDITGTIQRTATTDATGAYKFDGLLAGIYTIVQTQPAGFIDGKVTAGNRGGTVGENSVNNIDLSAGLPGANYNFGERSQTSLGGFVYHDANNNGVKDDGETGIADVLMTLKGVTAGGSVTKQVKTDASGRYLFEGLVPGIYSIGETQPSGFIDGQDVVGNAGGSLANDLISNITINDKTQATGYHFGELLTGSISGWVFHDLDENGFREDGENGISGVQVKLTGATNSGQSVSKTTTTKADGSYRFETLLAGTYTVTETQPTGWMNGAAMPGSTGGTVSGNAITMEMEEGISSINNNFAEIRGSSLAGKVFLDANDNGFIDTGETGLAGVKIKLRGTTADGEVSKETTTGSDGSYSFTNLATGTYTIEQTQPTTYADGREMVGTLGGTSEDNRFSNIFVVQGVTGQQYNFAEQQTASISGWVFEDYDKDGIQDTGEAGIGGVLIALTGETDSGPVFKTMTTTPDGKYSFVGLTPGLYTLEETYVGCHLDGLAMPGTAGGFAIDGNTITGISLDAGEKGLRYTFAEVPSADLEVTRTFSENPAQPGSTITYTITVTNHGPCDATNVVVEETLPPGFELVPGTPNSPGWTYTPGSGKVTFKRPTMATDESSVITFQVKVPMTPGPYTSTVTVTSKTPDDNLTNNTRTSTINVKQGEQQSETGTDPVFTWVRRLGGFWTQ